MYLMFINHYFDGGKWSDNNYIGCERFIKKFFNWINNNTLNNIDSDISNVGSNINSNNVNLLQPEDFVYHESAVINYMDSWKVNKVVSEWMIFYNKYKHYYLSFELKEKIVKLFNACF